MAGPRKACPHTAARENKRLAQMIDTSNIASPRECGRAARRAAKRVPGVARLEGCVCDWLLGSVPGVDIRIEERGRLYVEVYTVARLGQRLDLLGEAVQQAIAAELKPLPGVHLMAIDIIFTGIRYDKRALPKRKEHSQ
jgi:uncharacterized alkaline shock family protein YloU